MSDTGNGQTASGLDQAIEQYHNALSAFVTGDAAPQKEMFSPREDVSLAPGPRWPAPKK